MFQSRLACPRLTIVSVAGRLVDPPRGEGWAPTQRVRVRVRVAGALWSIRRRLPGRLGCLSQISGPGASLGCSVGAAVGFSVGVGVAAAGIFTLTTGDWARIVPPLQKVSEVQAMTR